MGKIAFRPLTPGRWEDLERLFGANGACGGCWCMWWRLKRSEHDQRRGAKNKAAMRKLVRSGHAHGILAYDAGAPVGWCNVEPREHYPVMARSSVAKPVDDQPVWSVACFYVAATHQRRGLSLRLLRAAVDYVRAQGGRIVEGYPVAPRKDMPGAWVWTGLASTFERAGFREVARRKATRPVMRRNVRPKR